MRQATSNDWDERPKAKVLAGPASRLQASETVESSVISPAKKAENRQPVVLIATQQLQLRAFGTTVLQAAGFRVLAETRGQAILDDIESLRPDLILTDPILDDMHAGRLCSRVRQLAIGRTVPILVISDQPDAPTISKILSEDFTDFISVPINWKILTFRIHRWISMAKKFRSLSDHEIDLEQVRDSALKASTELLQLRNYDSVTGLPNREMFLSTMGLVLSQNQRSSGYAAVLYLDLDDFKGVNDLIGRSLGDELLRIVAKRLQGCLRDGDVVSQAGDGGSLTSFARLNGDQFAILLSTVLDQEAAAAVAQRLLESVARPLTIRDRQFRLAARIGIADSSQSGDEEVDSDEEEALVQRAETAMRYCKQRKGKTYAFFESFMNELVLKKLELKAELRQAIDQEQLFLCYQLLVDSKTSVPTGVEGLVRWQHPTRGLVSPNDFLPVAEESDLIVEIDRWVLRSGCRQGKKWLDEGYPRLLISLNVSMRFLEEENFAKQILAIVDETGLPPSSLQLELSERGTLPDAGRIMSQFDKLVARGVQLALDDFGTGQTSLSYLRTLPISCVKVDQSFVRRVPDDSASVAIVTAIVAMSHHLGLKVVAEGVETDEHWRFLAEKDYDQLQGYLFSKPARAETLQRILRHPAPQRQLNGLGTQPGAAPSNEVARPRAVDVRPVTAVAAMPIETERMQVITAIDDSLATTAEVKAGPRRVEDGGAGPWSPPVPLAGSAQDRAPQDPDEVSPWSRAESEGQLLQLARNDFLTDLFNRFSFDERLEHAVAHADRFEHKVALLLIDLDDFKYVNDTHGHAVGDGLLIAVAARLKNLVRKVDTLARIGGDEFAVILSEFQDVRSVAEFAGRLLAVLARTVEVEGRELRVTGSVGVAVYPTGNTQAKDLLRQADLALYKVKNHGGNSVRFFNREMDREVQRRLALARDLSGAVDRGELFIDYQLQVGLRTGSIAGVEALLRWNHPEKGLIRPASFIPIAEGTGDIRAIGRWVIRSVCAQAKQWRSRFGRDLPVSVNLSPVQCRDSRFVDTILDALQENDLKPELLDFELNEKLLEHLPQGFEDSLRQLSNLGVSLTLDNFGSGSSALEHFQRFRFDRLKIHQSLVRTIGGRSVSASVLSGIVALARKMDVQIVAEGIEKPEEVECLLAEGCEIGQGFLFSKPQSADAISEILGSSTAFFSGAELEAAQPPVKGESPTLGATGPAAGATGPDFQEILDFDEIPEFPPASRLTLDEYLLTEPALTLGPAAVPDSPKAGADDPSADATSISAPAATRPEEAAAPADPLAVPAQPAVMPARAELTGSYAVAKSAAARTAPFWRRSLITALAASVLLSGSFLAWHFWSQGPEAFWTQLLAVSKKTANATEKTANATETTANATETTANATETTANATERTKNAVAATAAPPEPTLPPPALSSTPEPTAAAAVAPAAVNETAQPLIDLAQAWAKAWSDQRAETYLRLYAPEFRPPKGLSREVWEGDRRQRILLPREIEVRLSAIQASLIDDEHGQVSFVQSYRSDSYSDTVHKTLELIQRDGEWSILAERVEG